MSWLYSNTGFARKAFLYVQSYLFGVKNIVSESVKEMEKSKIKRGNLGEIKDTDGLLRVLIAPSA